MKRHCSKRLLHNGAAKLDYTPDCRVIVRVIPPKWIGGVNDERKVSRDRLMRSTRRNILRHRNLGQ